MEKADNKALELFEKDKHLERDTKQWEQNEDAIEEFAVERHGLEDLIWANNTRLDKVDNGEQDTRPADHFYSNIDQVQDNLYDDYSSESDEQ